jgi:hypothetical protein
MTQVRAMVIQTPESLVWFPKTVGKAGMMVVENSIYTTNRILNERRAIYG